MDLIDPILGFNTNVFHILWKHRDSQVYRHSVQWLFITNFVLAFLIMELCQCVVTLRIWHLFHRSRFIRGLAVTVLIASATGVATAGIATFGHIQAAVYGLYNPLNLEENPATLFVIYLPALVVHTTMISLTIYRFGITPTTLPRRGIVHRFLKEGMFMYVFAAGTLLYEIVALSLTRPGDMSVYYSALGGEIAVAATVISVCRAMLSIRSLAATCHVDPAWLLNHAELSRVHWRRGTSEGEIVVEVNEMDVVLPCRSLPSTSVEMEYPPKV
ncbi:hypothetical protein EV424DRAFT_41625 [Suillus variegatus]|nr:hypothetical protein EV424DRAFT_41625 [Suillus variegatus]